ncbi:hypothetical protein PF005_g15051 [Phytophthora fragariae]|uniref:Uncharacterized protein n=1 Tax=Phytophthora fragariae TaxID=53985 RepID=A0A6A3XPP8_9STRA|nr:hypothetical protein PF005_g15051 [Phytophthora fragariae]
MLVKGEYYTDTPAVGIAMSSEERANEPEVDLYEEIKLCDCKARGFGCRFDAGILSSTDRVVTLNGKLGLSYCSDSGSDYTVIGHLHWDELKTLDPSLVPAELDEPIWNQTFGSTTVTAKYKTKIHVTIHTTVDPVKPMAAVNRRRRW